MFIQHSSMPLSRVKINHEAKARYYTLEMKRVVNGYTWLGFHIVEMGGHINKKNLFITLERLNQMMEGDTLLYSTLETTKLNLKPNGEIESIQRGFERIDLPDPVDAPTATQRAPEPELIKPKRTRKPRKLEIR